MAIFWETTKCRAQNARPVVPNFPSTGDLFLDPLETLPKSGALQLSGQRRERLDSSPLPEMKQRHQFQIGVRFGTQVRDCRTVGAASPQDGTDKGLPGPRAIAWFFFSLTFIMRLTKLVNRITSFTFQSGAHTLCKDSQKRCSADKMAS